MNYALAAAQDGKPAKDSRDRKAPKAAFYEPQFNPDEWPFGEARALPSPEVLRKNAARLDALFDAWMAAKKVAPAAAASDETFLRRAYLALGGRIPTLEEADQFFADPPATRRAQLVTRIVESDDWTRHAYNFWAGLLRIPSYQRGLPARAYENWVKEAIRTDMPYDEFAKRLIAADGPTTATNAATGYVLRDMQQGVLDHVSMTSTVFLGSQIGCAMCHDAKFEKWKQTDFYALTAFFTECEMPRENGPVFKANRERQKEIEQQMQELRKNGNSENGAEMKALRQEMQALNKADNEMPYTIRDRKGKAQRLPADYKYDPNLRNAVIAPKVLYGAPVEVDASKPRRLQFAAWVASAENPNFVRACVNRHFQRVFGVGLVEPVDDLSEENTPISPEILDAASAMFVEMGFSQKAINAVFALTRAFGRAADVASTPREKWAGQSYPVRRLGAEVIWDSLSALTMGDAVRRAPRTVLDASLAPRPADMGNKGSAAGDMGEPSMTGAGMMMKGEGGPTMMSGGAGASMMSGADEATAPVKKLPLKGKKPYALPPGALPLSWDLPQPVNAGHFLDQFGASRRDVVSTGQQTLAMIQPLTLMNGIEVNRVVAGDARNNALLKTLLPLARKPDELARTAYRAVLGRPPAPQELEAVRDFAESAVGDTPYNVVSDLAWALVNQREFLFLR